MVKKWEFLFLQYSQRFLIFLHKSFDFFGTQKKKVLENLNKFSENIFKNCAKL
jgi:hypothetical protein